MKTVYSGDDTKVNEALQKSRGSMRDVLDLDELPCVEGEDTGELKHMRIHELVTGLNLATEPYRFLYIWI